MASSTAGSGVPGSFGEEEYRPAGSSSTAPQRQTHFQPRAGSPSRQLGEDMMFPENEEQGRPDELSPPPPSKPGKTTNVQGAVAYAAESLAWQTARQDRHMARHMEQINARFDELLKLVVATGSSRTPPTFTEEQLQTARSLQAERSTRSPQQQQQQGDRRQQTPNSNLQALASSVSFASAKQRFRIKRQDINTFDP